MSLTSDVVLDRMMSLHPKIIDLTLDRVHHLLAQLGHPERNLPPVVHVAGTNGKGSTTAMLRAGIEGAGKTAHVYTSPHLARFHERIRLAGTLITEEALTAVLDECYKKNGDVPITFFEITTIAGILAFSQTPADFTLLEVGLGGRLDATNVVKKPALTILTPISYDHQQYLGESLTEIAGEKAGILKRGVPCVVAPQTPEAMDVIDEKASKLGAPLLVHGQHWQVWEERGRLVFQDENGLLDLPMPKLLGAHQVKNAGAALMALRTLGLPETSYEAAMTAAKWPARMQRLKTGPLVDAAGQAELWLDGGHNPAAGEAVAEALTRLPPRPTHLIVGILNTKDVHGFLRPLKPHAESLHAVTIPGEKNTLSAEETLKAALETGHTAVAGKSVLASIQEITAENPTARILICGSLYLAGQVLRNND